MVMRIKKKVLKVVQDFQIFFFFIIIQCVIIKIIPIYKYEKEKI